MEIEAGRVLSGRYRLVRPLGQGSQASVWVAEHLALTTQVAVKLIDPELAKREDARERFRREATAAATLRSAHVVQMLDHGIDGDQPFIVMELLDGEDLFERLDKRGRLTLRETSRVVTQVARALARAHAAGIVHRDLKPENVFLVSNEDDEVVKVFDFGVAKVTDPTKAVLQKTSVGQLIGTPHYMSPEQVKGTGEVDFRADLWALGVITFQCVTGILPFESEGVGDLLIKITIGDLPVPSKVLAGLPPSFDAWFAKACNRDPTQRFESARELAEALARAVRGSPDAPGVAGIPRPGVARGAVPVTRSTPPPAFEQSGRQVLPAGFEQSGRQVLPPGLKREAQAIPAPVEKPVDKKTPAVPVKRPQVEQQLGSDDLEEVMSFDEEAPAVKVPPPARLPGAEKPKAPAAPVGSMPKPPPSVPGRPPPSPAAAAAVIETAPPPVEAPVAAPIAAAPVAVAPVAAAPPVAESPAAPPAAPASPAPPIADAAPAPVAAPAAAPVAAPIAPVPAAPSSSPSGVGGGSGAFAPVVRISALPPEPVEPALSAEPPWAQRPQPPRPQPAAQAPSAASGPPSSVPAFGRSDMLTIDSPPEFDGSRRKRLVKFLAFGLVAGVVIITWVVISSQIPVHTAAPEPSASAAPVAQPPKAPEPIIEADAAPVDPIKPAASTSAKPSTKPVIKGGRPGPGRTKQPKSDDNSIEIPDVPPE